MQQRLTFVTLGVSDLKRSRDFYENKFGWQPSKDSDENIVFFPLNGIILALFPDRSLAEDAGIPVEGKGFKKFSLAHNLNSEKEVDELVAQLEAKGVQVIKKPKEVFWGGYSSYVADPDGNLWELAYNPFLKLDNNGNILT